MIVINSGDELPPRLFSRFSFSPFLLGLCLLLILLCLYSKNQTRSHDCHRRSSSLLPQVSRLDYQSAHHTRHWTRTTIPNDRDLRLHFSSSQIVNIAMLPSPSAPQYMLCSVQFGASLLNFRLHVSLHD